MYLAVLPLLLSTALLAKSSPGLAPLLKLRDGHQIPSVALGTWLGYNKGNRVVPVSNEVQLAVEWALEAGYRHVDTAHIYQVEEQVGRGLASKTADGTVNRDELFITTKLWNDNHAKKDVVPALRESLKKLQLDYVDLYLIHWPVAQFSNGSYSPTDYVETWQGMVQARDLGLTKSIGLSNFNTAQMDRILASGETPSVLQVEINLNLQQPSLLEYCRKHDIRVMGYTPFGLLFPSKATPDAPPPRVDHPALVAMATKHNKTVPQVALRYLIELGVVPIPKSVTKSRIEENIDILDFTLDEEDKATLKQFDKNYRSLPQLKWKDNPYYPFTELLE